jgi:hypothetical protein
MNQWIVSVTPSLLEFRQVPARPNGITMKSRR